MNGTRKVLALALCVNACVVSINASPTVARQAEEAPGPNKSAVHQTFDSTHEGNVVRIIGNKLVMTGGEMKEHSHIAAKDIKVTLDGANCQLSDLRPRTRIRVTTLDTNTAMATRIEAIEKNISFASHFHDGTLVSMTDHRLTLANRAGTEQSLVVTQDAKLTLDGKSLQVTELKKGTQIRVFAHDPFSSTVIRIEAISENQTFASDQHDGMLVSLSNDRVLFTSSDGTDQTLSLWPSAILTLDGAACEVAELPLGTRVRVTTRDAFSSVATGIEALDRDSEFATEFYIGLVVNLTGNQLVMTDLQGDNEHACTLSDNAKISLDGKVATRSALKSGMKIRVTSPLKVSHLASRIEAIDKIRAFATAL